MTLTHRVLCLRAPITCLTPPPLEKNWQCILKKQYNHIFFFFFETPPSQSTIRLYASVYKLLYLNDSCKSNN